MNIIDKMNWRYACKSFDSTKKVSKEDLNKILESLRLSASSFGLQLWKFIVIENQKIQDSLVEHSWNQQQVAQASHVILFCRPKSIDDSFVDKYVADIAKTRGEEVESLKGYSDMMKGFIARKDERAQGEWMKNQLYIALGNLLTTAAIMDIDTCAMEGIIPSKWDEVLGLADKNLTSVVACPIGFRSSDDKYANSAKVRFPMEDVVEFI